MKDKSNRLDDYFRDSLGNLKMEPPAGNLERFFHNADKAGLIRKKPYRGRLAWILSGLLVVTTVAYFTLHNCNFSLSSRVAGDSGKKVQPDEPQSTLAENLITQLPITANMPNNHPLPAKTVTKSLKSTESGMTVPQFKLPENINKGNLKEQSPANSDNSYVFEKQAANNKNHPEAPEKAIIRMDGKKYKLIHEYNNQALVPDSLIEELSKNTQTEIPDAPQINYRKGFLWGFSLCYQYDQSLEDLNRNAHSISVETSLRRNRVCVTAGAGIMLTERNQQIQVLLNEYLGTYSKLDSITFSWDADRYHLIPTYYTSETTVFDSNLAIHAYVASNRYTYLKIPVSVAYDVFSYKRWVAGLKAGAEMNFFLDSQHRSGTYSAGMNKVIYEVPLDNGMQQNDLYLTGSIYADFRLNRRLTLSLEPLMRCRVTHQCNLSVPGRLRMPWLRASARLSF